MKLKRSEYSRFIQRLDRTAEKNPLLWLPCVLLIALALAGKHISEYVKIAYSHRNTEKVIRKAPQNERKPLFLRAVAVTLTASFSLMLVPAASFDAFGEEYGSVTEQTVFSEEFEEETAASEETPVPEETTVPAETTVPEETTVPVETAVPEDTTAPLETAVPEETPAPEETNAPEDTSASEETTVPEETSESEETTAPEETEVPEETSETEVITDMEETSAPEETIYPEEEEIPDEEVVSDEEVDLLANHEHTFHRWEQTEHDHWRVCTVCKQEFDRTSHDFAIRVVNPTQTSTGSKTFTCTVCGYSYTKPLPPVSHDHQFTAGWNYDTDSHWHICINIDCEAVGDLAAHSLGAWQNNASYHWRECSVCSYSSRRYSHNFGAWQSDGTNHWRECTDCGYVTAETAHSFSTQYDAANHWQECRSCHMKKEEAAHNLSTNWQTNDSTHWQGCTECGYSTTSSPHNKVMNKDETVHWYSCAECGWEGNKTVHGYVWHHTEDTHWQYCAACGKEKDRANHNFDSSWDGDADSHWHTCISCGLKKDEEAHDCEWDHLDSEHWRACSVCGEWFDQGEHVYKMKHNDKVHWQECVCGSKLSEEVHSFGDGVFTLAEDGETAVKRFTCLSFCGYFYDEPINHTHKHSDKWEYNSTDHWHECTSCQQKIDIASHDYSVNVTLAPTETQKGTRVYTCKVCGYSYNEAIPELGHIHSFGTEWRKDDSNHWHECVSCGERRDTAPHVSDGGTVTVRPTTASAGVKSYSCTICGYIIKTETIPALPPEQNNSAPVYYTPPVSAAAPLRLPYITNAEEVKGWENIAAYINASPDRVVVPITMNGETELPKDISELIMNRDITLEINMGGTVWTVNGLNVDKPKTVNLRVSERSDIIPSDAFYGLISEFEPKQYRLYNSGSFGFKAALTLTVGKKYNNYYAALYHYNTKTKQLEFVDESLVADWQVTFELTHASYYAVAFNSIPMYDDVSSGAGVFENPIPLETSAMPETNGVTIPAVKLPQIMKYSSKKRRYRVLKKRRLDDLVFVM